jgi:NAD(P)H-dependent FMN reductase
MILVISGTNRVGSNTLKVAKHYVTILEQKGQNVRLLSLEQLNSIERNTHFEQIENDLLIPATKLLILSPEYNGTFSGILKLTFDLSDVKQVFYGKKAAIVGIANGRAGNLRGLDHLTNILNYMKVNVMPNKLPISSVSSLIDLQDNIKDVATLKVIEEQIDAFINY